MIILLIENYGFQKRDMANFLTSPAFSVFESIVWFIACTLTDDQSMMVVGERFYEV